MSSPRPLTVLVLASALAWAACAKHSLDTTPSAAAAANTYPLRLIPTWKIGDKFGYAAEYSFTPAGIAPQTVHFEADGEILALLPNGDPRRVLYTINTIRASDVSPALKTKIIVLHQIVITYTDNGDRLVTYDNLSGEQREMDELLSGVLWLNNRKHTDQEKFGPPAPVAVGATWPLNAAVWQDDLTTPGNSITHLDGLMKFSDIQGVGEARTAQIDGGYTMIANYTSPGTPPEVTTVKSQCAEIITFPLNGHGKFREEYSTADTITAPNQPAQNSASKGFQEITLP